MTFTEYWNLLCGKNPPLKDRDTKMTITVASFETAMEQAFRAGQQAGVTPQADSLFWRLFG